VIEYEAPEDRAALAQTVATLAQAGFQADAEELSKRFGMKLSKAAPPSAFGAMPMAAESPGASDGESAAARALNAAMGKVLGEVDALAECEDPDEFKRRLDALCAETARPSSDTKQLESIMEEAMYGGFVAGVKQADDRMAAKARRKAAK
jgi:hypothetical protein